jgi:menaquinone-dependent protoporphyrinogen oxidase
MATSRILVLHASRHGSTRQIAEHIWRTLGVHNVHADLRAAEDFTDPQNYDAVVLGTAVYLGQWMKEADRYLEKFEAILKNKPLWIFASGPTGAGDALDLMEGHDVPENIMPLLDRIHPKEIRLFHGALDRHQLNMIERLMIRVVKAPTGDFRHWEDIAEWAKEISMQLEQPVLASNPMITHS